MPSWCVIFQLSFLSLKLRKLKMSLIILEFLVYHHTQVFTLVRCLVFEISLKILNPYSLSLISITDFRLFELSSTRFVFIRTFLFVKPKAFSSSSKLLPWHHCNFFHTCLSTTSCNCNIFLVCLAFRDCWPQTPN